jgi:hypothetical protein
LNDGFEIELEGIAFGMVDRQGHRWRCLITDRVLSDAIGGAPTQSGPSAVLWVGWLIALAALGFAGSGLSALPKSTSLGSQLFCYRRSIVTGCLLLAIANTLTTHGVRPTIIKDHLEAAADLTYDRWNSFSRITVSQNQTGAPSMFGASPRMPDLIIEQQHECRRQYGLEFFKSGVGSTEK